MEECIFEFVELIERDFDPDSGRWGWRTVKFVEVERGSKLYIDCRPGPHADAYEEDEERSTRELAAGGVRNFVYAGGYF